MLYCDCQLTIPQYSTIITVIVSAPFLHLYTYQGGGIGVISKKQILKHYKNMIFFGWQYFAVMG